MPNYRAPYAQTVIQFFNQLSKAGYGEGELEQIRDAWMLARRIFACRILGNGRIFLAHALGSASVLASVKSRPALVVAALLHNVYGTGRFADGVGGADESKRQFVRNIVGPEVEDILFRFWSVRWNVVAMQDWLQRERLDPWQQDLLTVRMADAIDHAVMLGLAYQSDQRSRQRFDLVRKPMIVLARKHGLGQLARAWLDEMARYDRYQVAEEIAAQSSARSEVILPASYRRGLRHQMERLRARARSSLKI